jgi:YHS domain-containing protein
MKAAAAGFYGETSEDPVCGMEVDQSKAKAAGRTAEYKGQTYYFCSDDCKEKFGKEPARYTAKAGSRRLAASGGKRAAGNWQRAASAERAQSAKSRGKRAAGSGQRRTR